MRTMQSSQPRPYCTAEAFTGATWRKSSYTQGAQGDCVELAARNGFIGVRDSKNPSGPVLVFTRAGFGVFVAGLRENSKRIL